MRQIEGKYPPDVKESRKQKPKSPARREDDKGRGENKWLSSLASGSSWREQQPSRKLEKRSGLVSFERRLPKVA